MPKSKRDDWHFQNYDLKNNNLVLIVVFCCCCFYPGLKLFKPNESAGTRGRPFSQTMRQKPLRRQNVKLMLVVEFMCISSTRMPGESCRRRLRSLLLCYVCRALMNSPVCLNEEDGSSYTVCTFFLLTGLYFWSRSMTEKFAKYNFLNEFGHKGQISNRSEVFKHILGLKTTEKCCYCSFVCCCCVCLCLLFVCLFALKKKCRLIRTGLQWQWTEEQSRQNTQTLRTLESGLDHIWYPYQTDRDVCRTCQT